MVTDLQGFRRSRYNICYKAEKVLEFNSTAFLCLIELRKAFDFIRISDVFNLFYNRRVLLLKTYKKIRQLCENKHEWWQNERQRITQKKTKMDQPSLKNRLISINLRKSFWIFVSDNDEYINLVVLQTSNLETNKYQYIQTGTALHHIFLAFPIVIPLFRFQ